MTTSTFTLHPGGKRVIFTGPEEIKSDVALLSEQGVEALRVMRGLNTDVCGYPVGPFRQIHVFNQETT